MRFGRIWFPARLGQAQLRSGGLYLWRSRSEVIFSPIRMRSDCPYSPVPRRWRGLVANRLCMLARPKARLRTRGTHSKRLADGLVSILGFSGAFDCKTQA